MRRLSLRRRKGCGTGLILFTPQAWELAEHGGDRIKRIDGAVPEPEN
jgi:hypothetical protein